MSNQPPGPYPAFPQYPGPAMGMPPRPPAPQTVLRAYYAILAGAALSLIGVVVTLTQMGSIRTLLETSDPNADQTTVDSLVTATIAAACVMGVVEVGLWIWMAFATKAGKNWARVLSTVFFGLNAAGTVFGTLADLAGSSSSSSSTTFASSDTTLGQIVGWLTFLAGLGAIVLLWNKESTAYFKPVTFYPAPGPYGYPGMPPGAVPYDYPVMPQQPGPAPRDPWGTPPSN
jgi:hypothetical protein